MSRQRCLLDTVLRAMHSALALVDGEGRIVYANTEFARLARCQGEVLHLMQVRHLPDYLAWSVMWNSSGGQGRNFPIRKT